MEQVNQMDRLNDRDGLRMVRAAACLALVGVLSACGSSSSGTAQQTTARPDGVYIIQDGKVGRLNEDPQKILKTWDQRTNLTPNVQFLVVDPSVAAHAPDADTISLQRVSKVRNVVSTNGKAKKSAKTEWVVANLPQDKIPVTVVRDSDTPHQMRVTANQPLAPGLYSITYNTGAERVGGRFGVGWAVADKTQYAGQHCVDRYAGNPASYRPCSEFVAAKPKAAAKPVQQATAKAAVQRTTALGPIDISGLKVQKEIVGGKPLLVLQGQMTNVTSSPQKVPLLFAVVTDKQGRELSRWPFRTLTDQLPPGGTATFQTSTDSPPKGTASIAVLTAESLKPQQEADSQPAEPSFMQVQELPAP
jgi:hypothetical protein